MIRGSYNSSTLRNVPATLPNMRPRFSLLAILLSAAPAHAAGPVVLDLPVRTAGSFVAAPCYRGDELELRLAPHAARAVNPRGALPTRAAPSGRLGVSAVDALVPTLGITAFEPEFRGEVAPESDAETDFTAFQIVHLAPGAGP